jgi:large subunit ribosomal protein L9
MKIILRDNLDNLGILGEVVTVAPGYARNYLIPRGLAVVATKGNLNQFEAEKETWLKKAAKLKADKETIKTALEGVELSFTRKSGEEGKLFGSVTSMDIEAALKDKGFDILRRHIIIGEQLKSVGNFTVNIKLHHEVSAEIKIEIIGDKVVEEVVEAVTEAPEEAEAAEGVEEPEATTEPSPEAPAEDEDAPKTEEETK